MTLKLYHWKKVEALQDYQRGEAIALANNKREAIEVIMKEREITDLRQELTKTKPKVYTKPKGIAIWGSA